MNTREAINIRCSRRTYLPEYIREKDAKPLFQMINRNDRLKALSLF